MIYLIPPLWMAGKPSAGDAVRRRIMPEHARIRKAAEKIRECLRKLEDKVS